MAHYPGGSLVWQAPQVHTLVYDEQIGAVEIKDATTDDRAAVVDVLGVKRLAVDATVSATIADVGIDANVQIQNTERALAVLAPGTWNGASRDCQNFADFAVSVYAARVAADTTLDVVVECSLDGATWREVDRQVLTLDAVLTTATLNRNYTATRRYMRVSVVNNTANANVEVVTNLKPIG